MRCGRRRCASSRGTRQLSQESGGPGNPRDGAGAGESDPAAQLPSRFRPFGVTSTPLYRPHLSGGSRTAPAGGGEAQGKSNADWAIGAPVVGNLGTLVAEKQAAVGFAAGPGLGLAACRASSESDPG